MIHPKRLDGFPVHVTSFPDGRVFVDAYPLYHFYRGGRREMIHRSGPEHPRHFHRFEYYGLADGLVRCRKCGLVKENNG